MGTFKPGNGCEHLEAVQCGNRLMNVRNHLAELRERKGLSAAKLASAIGVSRQTVYAIESGSYVPNTSVSLRLARVLSVKVEEIFELYEERGASGETVRATLLPTPEEIQPGQPLRLCNVERKAVAFVPEVGAHGIGPFEGVLSAAEYDGEECQVDVFDENWNNPNRLLIAGCDPGTSVLARQLGRSDVELLVSYQNSLSALDLLKQKLCHLAGTHLVNRKTGKFDVARTKEMFGGSAITIISYATWEEGLALGKGNPKGITGVADLKRADVRIVNREPGAACRNLLDSLLRENEIQSQKVRGYDTIAYGHLPAARQILNGEADTCVCTRAAAKVLGLDFIPLAQRPYHLITWRKYLKLPQIEALLDLLGRDAFRRDVELSTGYNMQNSGAVIA